MNYEAAFPHLDIIISKLPKVAFAISNMEIYFYGILIAAGVAAGTCYASRESKRTNQNSETYMDFIFYALIISIVGARLYYVAFSWENYKNDLLSIFDIRNGGLAIYGGVIAAVFTAFIYTWKKEINFGLFADTTAPGLILGQAIGRWGNFFNREVFGGYTDNVFAMQYLREQVRFVPEIVLEKAVMVNGALYIQVHPTFLYESMWNLAVFILMNVYKKYKKFDGEIFGIYLLGYGVGRFWIEGVRTDQLFLWGTNLPVSQLLSFVLVTFSIIYIFINRRKLTTHSPDK